MRKSLVIFLKSYPINIIIWKLIVKFFNIKISNYRQWQFFFKNKNGIEIGGPSSVFKTTCYLPLYSIIETLDGVNFSNTTIWEGSLSIKEPYRFENKIGKQFIAEGSDLNFIENNYYDFLLSCNNLEHIANPIKAIVEWKRIIKVSGLILLILPNKKANFDHKREYTTIEHLIDDYRNDVDESDLTHLTEILNLHDLQRDAQAGSFEQFKSRCKDNLQNRCLHHHVFSEKLLEELLVYCDIKVKLKKTTQTDIFILAQKQD
jgi:hypothetical protein